ncbi:MAG TPA: hypothetical protein EYP23_06420 [Thermoplasmata archaeon]|nr:hypothetical protein [Thermoplasmata archaeon]
MFRGVRYIKISFILSILLFSTLANAPQEAEAGPILKNLAKLYRCEPKFKVEYDKTVVQNPITPLDKPYEIPIEISCVINGLLADIVAEVYDDKFFVDLYVDSAPEWCIATVDPPLIEIPISSEWITTNATVSLTIKENAPAFEEGILQVRVKSRSIGMQQTIIPEGNISLEIPFTVGYIPILGINVTNGYYRVIDPYETAFFEITISNLGNGKTEVSSEITQLPEGWTAEIPSNIILGSRIIGDNPEKTIQLVVKPSYSFGYHEEQGVVKISLTPYSLKNTSLKGEPYMLSFIVQNRGFSLPGFEGVLALFALISLAFCIKTKNNSSRRKGK